MRGVEIDFGAAVIEMHADVWIALCRFDDRGVERGASDRIDAFVRIDIVRGKMQLAGSVVNHSTAHRDRVLQYFVGDSDLFERVNSARRNRQIDRAPADDVSFARISAPFVKIDFVSAPPEIRREQSASESAADQNKFCHSPRIYESGTQESRKDCETDARLFRSLYTDALQFLERVAEVIKNVARQQRLLALVAVEDCDLRCATA